MATIATRLLLLLTLIFSLSSLILQIQLSKSLFLPHAPVLPSQSHPIEPRTSQNNTRIEEPNITRKGTNAIVFLAQFGHHSTYGNQTDGKYPINGYIKLNKSLDLLYRHYLDAFPCDVIILYGGDDEEVDESVFESLRRGRERLQFRQLHGKWWSLPHNLQASSQSKWRYPGFSLGYRHMMQFYAVRIWPYLSSLGYTHVMRLDDDSYIYSDINYDLFAYMKMHGMRYALRQPVMELNSDDYIQQHQSTINPQNLWYYQESNKFLSFYNNFFIADISFFMTPPASDLIKVIDESKKIYEERTGDLHVHSALVRLFMPLNEILWIRDFTYEHTTFASGRAGKYGGCFQNGGISRGEDAHTDEEWDAIADQFESRFSHNPACNKAVRTKMHAGAGDIERCESMSGRCGMCLAEFSSKPDL